MMMVIFCVWSCRSFAFGMDYFESTRLALNVLMKVIAILGLVLKETLKAVQSERHVKSVLREKRCKCLGQRIWSVPDAR